MASLIDIGSAASALVPVINRVLDFIPDKNAREREKAAITASLIEIVSTESANQAQINLAEASNPNLFVSGWRPMIGWVCAISFAWFYLGVPIISWILAIAGVHVDLPVFDKNSLMELTMGMLGMGALRSFDKWRGTAK